MANLSTIAGNIFADSGIDPINVVLNTGSYSNPSWITALSWTKISDRPTTLAGYGISDAVPSSRTLTINGTSYDLSANRSWTIAAGVSSIIAGTGISVSGSGDITITNTGVLSINGSTGAITGIITTSNYNSYSPTLTGGGASGTWGINVTGTAGSISGFNNPTTAATANTIAYRDASGDITAREFALTASTIHTETPSSIVGIYPTTNQVVKFGNTAVRNFLNVPTRTGGDASGTWGINVTGYSTYLTSNNGSVAGGFVSWNGNADTTNNPNSDYWYGMRVSHGDALSYYSVTFAVNFFANTFQYRRIVNGVNQGWITVLDSGNYNSYSPTLGGGGASGTWGISVTGTAASTNTLMAYGGSIITQAGSGTLIYNYALVASTTGLFPTGDNSNGIITINRHPDNYYSQLGFNSSGSIFYRSFSATPINTSQPWQTLLTSSNYNSYALPLSGGTISGTLVVQGGGANGVNVGVAARDVTAARSSNTGVLYLGSDGSHYVYFNGSSYDMPSGNLIVNGSNVLTAGNYSSYAIPISGGINMTGSFGMNDSKLYLRGVNDNNHYIWNADDDWEEVVAYFGTGLRIKASDGVTLATFSKSGNTMNILGSASTASAASAATFLTQPNATWGARMQLGGNGTGSGVANIAVVQATDGNLHMDNGVGKSIYLNYYHNGIIYLSGSTYYISANGSQYNGNSATATNATNVAWSGITSKPSAIMFYEGFTLDANTMSTNSTGFSYAVNAPTVGPIVRVSAGGSYDLQLNAAYSGGGTTMYFRTRNGDISSWNSWHLLLNATNQPYAYNMNQYVRTSDSPTFYDLYSNQWIRNNVANTGLYNTATTMHWSSQTNGYWDASSTTSVTGIRFYTGSHMGTLRGFIYADSSSNIGFLTPAGGWSLRMDSSGNATVTNAIYATTFYDNNDSTYYVDPAGGTSAYLNGEISLPGVIRLRNGGATTTYIQEAYGIRMHGSSIQPVQAANCSLLVGTVAAGGGYGSGNIYATGDVTAYYSDGRLKHNLNRINNALSKVLSLNGYTYQHNILGQELLGENPNKIHSGLIAQEVQKVLSEVVTIAPFDLNGFDDNGNGISKSGENYLTIKYERLVPLLIEAIKEQQIQIEELKKSIN